ncbi:MAG TPA: hypothetical protein PK724_01560, partial [Pseudomonadales bacterium]|nr:hypothetical protein [Pseudomonadales bacterium]
MELKKILVVEDDPGLQKQLKWSFDDYEVVVAGDREEAIAALREAGPITVLDLEEAKSVTRATLDTSTTVIVATRQAFQVEEEECRKVYQSSGALMH